MNHEEIDLFLQPLIKGLFQTQRMLIYLILYKNSKLYWWYSCCSRSIKWTTSNRLLQLKHFLIKIVYIIAKELILEVIGWIFIGINEPEIALSSYDIRKAVKFQQEYFLMMKEIVEFKLIWLVICVKVWKGI